MANIVLSQINIGKQSISYYSSLTITQKIFEHDSFELVLPSEYIEGKANYLFQQSKNLIGEDFVVQSNILNLKGAKEGLQFIGIITSIKRSRSNGYNGDLVISGFAPTILLDSGPHCKSWQDRTLESIFNEVVNHFPANKINAKIKPRYKEPIPYVVQYEETAWEFIKRLCATYGEWLYFSKDALIIGTNEGGNPQELVFGSDLSSFDLNMELKPVNKQVINYDYSNTAVYDRTQKIDPSEAGLDELGVHAWKKSQTTFASAPKSWDGRPLTAVGQLDDAISANAYMQGSSLVMFEGEGSFPAIKLGGKIHVNGSNIYSFLTEDYGSYLPIQVTHKLGMNNKYTNSFTAVPSAVVLPPIQNIELPRCDAQSAIVTDNNDPLGMGRIKVKFHWMKGVQTTPWIRVTTPHAGGGKGMFFLPEIGEEVIVGFEGNNAIRPYVVGTVYNSVANNSYANAGNDVKALQTRSGNQLIYNDNDGSITAKDSCGNVIFMDGKGNITITASSNNVSITAPETMTLNAKNLNINVSENMNTSVGMNNSQNIGMNDSLSVGGSGVTTIGAMHNLSVIGNSMMTINGSLTEIIEGDAVSDVKKDRNETSKGDLSLNSQKNINKHAQDSVQNNSAEKSLAH